MSSKRSSSKSTSAGTESLSDIKGAEVTLSKNPVDDVTKDDDERISVGKRTLAAMLNDNKYIKTRIIKSSNSSTPTITIEGIVLSAKPFAAKGRKEGTTVPKLDVLVFCTKTRNTAGARDYVDAGVPGVGYFLPSHKPSSQAVDASLAPDDGPEAALVAKRLKPNVDPPRTLALVDGHKTIWSGVLRTSIDTQVPGGGEKEGISLIKPGMAVELTGSYASLGNDGRNMYLNGARVEPLRNEVAAGTEVKRLIRELSMNDSALASAFLASQAAHGFFNFNFEDSGGASVKLQAEVFMKLWSSVPDALARSCDNLAATLKSEGLDDDANVDVEALEAHSTRIKSIPPEALASGDSLLFSPHLPLTEDRPAFCAPITQFGKVPGIDGPGILWDLIEGRTASIPKTFVAADIQSVEFQGATINLPTRLYFVGDRDMAMASFKSSENGVLNTGSFAALGIKLNMREFCGLIGTTVKHKAEMVCSEMLPYADIVSLAKIVPKPFQGEGIRNLFPDANHVDVAGGIVKVGAPVSEAFVIKELAGGATQFVYEKDSEMAQIKDKEGKDVSPAMPQLKAAGYQAVSESGFKFSASKTPLDKPIKTYYVVFEGSSEKLGEGLPIHNAHDAGEIMVKQAAKSLNLEVGEFLTAHAVVYCVATAK